MSGLKGDMDATARGASVVSSLRVTADHTDLEASKRPNHSKPLRWWFAYNLYQLNLLVANLLGYVGIHFGKVGMDVTWSDHLPADHSCCVWAVKEHL